MFLFQPKAKVNFRNLPGIHDTHRYFMVSVQRKHCSTVNVKHYALSFDYSYQDKTHICLPWIKKRVYAPYFQVNSR